MKLKEGVSIDGCRAEILRATITIIEPLFIKYEKECIITSGTEKFKHKALRSAHYRGDALDFRTRFFTQAEKLKFFEELSGLLGNSFYCVLERTHLHVEYSPIFMD